MSIEFTVGMAGLHAGLQSLRAIANAGLISPRELDETLDGVIETLENLPPEILNKLLKRLDPVFAEMKSAAKKNWKAK